jgi:putative PIN family toxin of toxin-antitoxin system
MTNKPLFVFDTNVLVSAVLVSESTAHKALDKALTNGQLAHSLVTLDELREVLERRKFDKYITREERVRFFTSLIREAKLVEVKERIKACRDPKDDKFLELAVSAEAQKIISGDDDLLVLNPFRDISIVTPSAFLTSD